MTTTKSTTCRPTRTLLGDWVRGTTTHKILADGRVYFIQPDADGFHLYVQRITGTDSRGRDVTAPSVYLEVHPTEAAARHAADARA